MTNQPEPPAPDQVQLLTEMVRKNRRSLRRLRQRVAARDASVAKQAVELSALRSFTLNVFPDLELPSSVAEGIEAVRSEHLTFLTAEQLRSLAACTLEVEATQRPGLIVEAGTARGGSAIVMALAKQPTRELKVYDVFGTIPPPTEADGEDVAARYAKIIAGESSGPGDGEEYYGYRENLLGEVEESFARHGAPIREHHISLVPGLFQDTIAGTEPIALAHIDGDWYESTLVCLVEFGRRLVSGGRIVIDDYYTWAGCRAAVDEYVAAHEEFVVEMRAKVHLVKRPTH